MSRLAVVIALALGVLACTYAAPGGETILSSDGGVAGVVSDGTHIASFPPQEHIVPVGASDHGERIKRGSSAAAAAASSGGGSSSAAASASAGGVSASAAASASSG